MNPVAHAVPRDAVDVARFIDNFRAEHGLAPFGGGEAVAGAPPAQTAPPPAAPPAAPQLPGGVDPAVVQQTPAAPQQPAAPQAAPQVPPPEQQPEWMQGLIDRMDRLAPPGDVDPLAAELGLVPPPAAQPQTQMQPPASPAQQQMPQQPGTPFPGVQPDQQQQFALIQNWIREEAEKAAQGYVDPRFEQLQNVRRREEYDGLRQDYAELQDPVRGQEVVSRARQWAAQMGNEDLVREPMFLEMTVLASRQMEAARQALAQQPVPPAVAGQPQVPGQPQPYPIEQPGPAAPAPTVTPEKAISQRIVGAGGSRLSPQWV